MRGTARLRDRGLLRIGAVAVAFAVVFVPGALGRSLHGSVFVAKTGDGKGTVVGTAGSETLINCGSSCNASIKDTTDPEYSPVTLKATPEPGSVFKGWFGGCSGTTNTCVIEIKRLVRVDVTAWFDIAPASDYPLTVTLAGSGRVVSNPAGIDCGAACAASFPTSSSVTLNATPAAGWTFAGWSGSCSGADACTVTIDQARSVTATFSPPSLPLSVAVAGPGEVISSPDGLDCTSACVGNFPGGATVTLSATPGGGATFIGWGGACTGTAPTCTVALSVARAVTAAFSGAPGMPLAVVVTGSGSLVSAPAGIACGAKCGAVFPAGSPVTLTAKPDKGWRLEGWGLACTGGSETCVVRLSAGRGVRASFVRQSKTEALAVTKTGAGRVTSVPKGIDCGARCTASPATGSTVVLTATPAAGSLFVRWSGDCNGAKSTCRLTMTRPRTVAAEFAASSDKTPPVVRALKSDGTKSSGLRLRYKVVEAGGRSRETATVFAGKKRLATITGPMDAVDPDTLFDFLVWRPAASVHPGTYRFCVTSVDPSGNTSRPGCATAKLG